MNKQLVVFLLLLHLGGNIALKGRETVFEKCCQAGALFAEHNRHLNCSQERGLPISTNNKPEVATEASDTVLQEQVLCTSTQYVCCLEKHRQLQCSEGISTALEEKDCTINTSTSGHEGFKDCCNGCKLGLTAASLQAACSSERYSLLTSWKESFTECCSRKKHQQQSSSSASNDKKIINYHSPSSASVGPPHFNSESSSTISTRNRNHISSYQTPSSTSTNQTDIHSESQSTTHPITERYTVKHITLRKPNVGKMVELENRLIGRLKPGVVSSRNSGGVQVDLSHQSPQMPGSTHNEIGNMPTDNKAQTPGRTHLFLGAKGPATSDSRTTIGRASLPDVDVCQIFSTGLCQHLCISMAGGSYRCECRAGFKLNADGSTCSEIDEKREKPLCEMENPCGQVCGQTAEGIICSCHEGFQLANDGVNCIDVDECAAGVHECLGGHMCFNEPSGYGCLNRESRQVYRPLLNKQHKEHQERKEEKEHVENRELQEHEQLQHEHGASADCPDGFRFNSNSTLCDDVDECEESAMCPDHQQCQNTIGSFRCAEQFSSCPEGFLFDTTFQTCIDIDECDERNICGAPGHVCVNTPGSYTCVPGEGEQCPAGFKPSPREDTPCQDVDECRERLDGCDVTNEVCRNTIGGYECDVKCLHGFEYDFLSDSCQDIDECVEVRHNCSEDEVCVNTEGGFSCANDCGGRCGEGEECVWIDSQYECVSGSGVASQFSRSCPVGFTFSNQTQQCEDIDECVVKTSVCDELPGKLCVNTAGSFICAQSDFRCPIGFVFNSQLQICIDVDECETGTHNCSSASEYCSNLVGGYICRRRFDAPSCATGFLFNSTSSECQDIDECTSGEHNCEQPLTCINLPGRYTCSATVTSSHSDLPKANSTIKNNDRARFRIGTDQTNDLSARKLLDILSESDINPAAGTDHDTDKLSETTSSRCHAGFKQVEDFCVDVDECSDDTHLCSRTLEKCVNIRGGYRCILQATPPSFTPQPPISSTPTRDYSSRASGSAVTPAPRSTTPSSVHVLQTSTFANRELVQDKSAEQQPGRDSSYREIKQQGGAAFSNECQSGKMYSQITNRCEEINDCAGNSQVCGQNALCVNTGDRYICQCSAGFRRDGRQNTCVDINECQLGMDNCLDTQRCDNTIGSFSCFRTLGCGTGYTLNADLGTCEDDDECALNWHDCGRRGRRWRCLNTRGSYRCILTSCPPGRTLSPDRRRCLPVRCRPGYAIDRRGRCGDIDECASSPCDWNSRCVNVAGSFRCESTRRCPPGYQTSADGSACEDIDECSRGRSPCESDQQCSNTPGGYQCMCPSGYSVSQLGHCQDIDECQDLGSTACGADSECVNTVGSYLCRCADGFEQIQGSSQCTDLDECRSVAGLCQHRCRNTWGSYHCHCDPGYTLNADRRTCVDIDECSVAANDDRGVCVGQCRNTDGSYECSCPRGYRLSADGVQCEDINECSEQDVCNAEDLCLNINGGYRCNRIDCPAGYIRDRAHKNRCTRQSLFCPDADMVCRKRPLSYSFTYLTFTADLAMPPSGQHQLFTMRGPLWPDSRAVFRLKLVSARDGGAGVPVARAGDFQLKHSRSNQATVALVNSVAGPQDIELQLVMDLYRQSEYRGRAVAKLFIVVSAHRF